MEIICWMQPPPPVCQLPQGLVMLPPLYSHTLHPTPTTSDVASLFCFPRYLIFCTEPICHLNRHSHSSFEHLVSTAPTWSCLKWTWSSCSKNPLWWLYRFTSVANQLLTVTVVQHKCEEGCFDNRKVSYSQPASEDSITQLWLCSIPLCVLQCGTLWGNLLSPMTDNPPHRQARTKQGIKFQFWWHCRENMEVKMKCNFNSETTTYGNTGDALANQSQCLLELLLAHLRIKGASQTTNIPWIFTLLTSL